MNTALVSTLIAAAWLTPWAEGPLLSVYPWLAAWLLLAGLLTQVPLARVQPVLLGVPLALMALAVWRSGPSLLVGGGSVAILGLGLAGAAIGARAAHSPPLLRAIAWGWLIAAVLNCLIGLCQYLQIEHLFAPWMNPTVHGYVYGNLRQRNQFATLCSIGLVVLMMLAGQGLARRHAVWLLVLLAVGNAISASHTGTAQWVVVACIGLVWRARLPAPSRWVAMAAVPVYAAVSLGLSLLGSGLPSAFSRLGEEGRACAGRRYLWGNVTELIAQQPWWGWGWHDLAWAHFSRPFERRFCDLPDNAHNLPLQLAVELGVPVALLFTGLLLWAVLRARPWREADPQRQLAWAVFGMILMHTLVEYPLWFAPFQLACGICLGLLWPARRPPAGVHAGSMLNASAGPWCAPDALRVPAGQWLAAAALALGVGYAAWDYHRVCQIFLPPEQRSAAYRDDALGAARASWLYAPAVDFAELCITPVTAHNAARLYTLALSVVHFSPEPLVVQKLIEAARLSGHADVARHYEARLRDVYPQEHARWAQAASAAGGAR